MQVQAARRNLCIQNDLANPLDSFASRPNELDSMKIFKDLSRTIVIQRNLLPRSNVLDEFESSWNVSRNANGLLCNFDFTNGFRKFEDVMSSKKLTSIEFAVLNEITDLHSHVSLYNQRLEHLSDKEKGLELIHLFVCDILG